MSKKTTHTSGFDLVKNSFYELFHPSSESVLIDYQQFDLIDWHQLNVVEWNQLKVVDADQLRLVDTKQLASFFEYIGALAIILFILAGFSIGFLDPRVNNGPTGSKIVLGYLADANQVSIEDEPRIPAQAARPIYENYEAKRATKHGVFSEEYEVEMRAKKVAPVAVMAHANVRVNAKINTQEREPEVAGVFAVVSEVPAGHPARTVHTAHAASEVGSTLKVEAIDDPVVHSCSFKVENTYYAHGSEYPLSEGANPYICAQYSSDVSASIWEVVGSSPDNRVVLTSTEMLDGCMEIDMAKAGYSLEVTVYDDSNRFVDTCVLNFVR